MTTWKLVYPFGFKGHEFAKGRFGFVKGKFGGDHSQLIMKKRKVLENIRFARGARESLLGGSSIQNRRPFHGRSFFMRYRLPK